MTTLSWILIFCLLGGVLSVLAASVYLLFPEHIRRRSLPHLVSYAIGALLGAAFLGLLPHALESEFVTDSHNITFAVLIGILVFFLLEKLVLWRHCHSAACEVHTPEDTHDHHHDHDHHHHGNNKLSGSLVLFGDASHNFVDGILIAAAFLTDIHLGMVTALAVAAHEIPQEVGDFAVLLNSGFTRAKALLYNVLSSLTTVLGGLVAYFSLSAAEPFLPYVLAVAAASFIYVAVADLIPSLHKRTSARDGVQQVLLISLGVATIFAAHSNLH
ncbi:MAG: ZIP family metal transporter [Gammaproteobacteria bacterium]|nr:ZIP family metal transporter [Gammaproteobacteria bacterium]